MASLDLNDGVEVGRVSIWNGIWDREGAGAEIDEEAGYDRSGASVFRNGVVCCLLV